jgi:hypothetical protein
MSKQILALDLARKTGWALRGIKDNAPQSGSIRIAKKDAGMGELLSAWRSYLRDFLSMHPEIGTVVFEAPMDPTIIKGPRRPGTARQLIGLAAVTEELLCTLGKYDIREARVSDVRCHFIGSNRHKRPEAKAFTIKRCFQLGWNPIDDNAADALALWDYQRSILIKDELIRRAG